MAQLDGMRRYGENQNSTPGSSTRRYADNAKTPVCSRYANYSSKSPTTMATIEELLQGSGGGGRESYSRRSSNTSPTTASKSNSPVTQRHNDPQEDHSPVLRKSSSVLARVKEKAKKWRRTLSNKKKPTLSANPTPSWDASLGGHDHDDDEEDQEEDPEYLGAPMYESELAPEAYKEAARQHPRAIRVLSEKHVLVSSENHLTVQAAEPKPANDAREKPAPPCSVAADAASESPAPSDTEEKTTQGVTFKIQDLHVSDLCAAHTSTTEQTSSSVDQVWDKGVSVKEYLMHKLEPGEDEKALSQIISDAISPRISAGNVGVVEKMKVAVNSLLRSDQVSSSAAAESSALNSASHVPASTNAHEVVVEEENHGRVLQAN